MFHIHFFVKWTWRFRRDGDRLYLEKRCRCGEVKWVRGFDIVKEVNTCD